MREKSIQKQIDKGKLISLDTLLGQEFKTLKSKNEFEKGYQEFLKLNRAEVLEELGSSVKQIRKELGITQDDLAQRLKTKKSVISRIENGDQNLTVEYILRIAIILGRRFEIRIF